MKFVELSEYVLKLRLGVSFKKEKCLFHHDFSLPITSFMVCVKKRIWTEYAFLGKDTSMLKNVNQNIKRQII